MEFDQTVIKQVVETSAARARGEEPSALPHQIETDIHLQEHLAAVGKHLLLPDDTQASSTALDKLAQRARGSNPAQADFNSHLVHIIHQLDHRSLSQRREIAVLHNELAENRAQLAQLQRQLERLAQ